MRPVPAFLSLLLLLGCESTVGPNPIYPSYYLINIDDKFLPVPWGGDGSVLIDATLLFDRETRPRAPRPTHGTVRYTLTLRSPDQTLQRSTVDLDYAIQNGELHINLCPPPALCFALAELVGTVSDPALELVLTHYVGGLPVAVYRYSASLLE
jgi:hypothetical protein